MEIKKDVQKMEITDTEEIVKKLIINYKNGNRDAFKKIVEMYYNQVVAAAYKMVSDYDEAADIAQSVFMKLMNNIWRFDHKKKFYTWLYRITVNASIDYIRKNKRHKHESLDIVNAPIEGAASDPGKTYNNKQIRGFIDKATEKLNDKQRSAAKRMNEFGDIDQPTQDDEGGGGSTGGK